MKKELVIFALFMLLLTGGVWYMLNGAGDLIRVQLEQQGSKYLGTAVSVFNVDIAVAEGRIIISDLDIDNPKGFSDKDAFSINSFTLDLGEFISEPYVIQAINIDMPEILYEVNATGNSNLIELKNNLAENLLKSEDGSATTSQDPANPLVIVENVTVSNVRLRFNFEQLSTGDLNIDTKSYEITLPTFTAGPIGQPNGMPANKVGVAVVNAMLKNVIIEAKSEAKKRLAEAAKKKVKKELKKELEKQKDKLLDKAKNKLKDLFN